MNIKEAIDSIKGCVYVAAIEYNTTEEEDDYDEEALAIAVDAMKKQEPMKGKIVFGGWLDCPTCETDISGFEERPYYCPNCGQAIDWED